MRKTKPLISLSSPKLRTTPDAIMAYDDDGHPITGRDLTNESTRMPPLGMPRDIAVNVPHNVDDNQWERIILIEQIRFRRKTAPMQHSGGTA